MKKIKLRKMYAFIGAVMIGLALININTHAEEIIPVEEDKVGSIEIKLTDTKYDLKKEGVEFGITKVADWNSGGDFINAEEVKNAGIDLNKVETADDMESAARKLQKVIMPETTIKTDNKGVATFHDLKVGMYLVNVVDYGEYENITPFLVSIPTFNEVDNVMEYDVTVLPKHEPFPTVLINKVDSVSKKNITNKDFEFTLYADKECKKEIEIQAGDKKKGTADFILKDEGTFYIKETKAPKGYRLSKEVVKVEFSGRGLLINDKKCEHDEDNVYSIVYQNALMPAINTGSTNDMSLFLCSMLGIATLLGALVYYRKKLSKQVICEKVVKSEMSGRAVMINEKK